MSVFLTFIQYIGPSANCIVVFEKNRCKNTMGCNKIAYQYNRGKLIPSSTFLYFLDSIIHASTTHIRVIANLFYMTIGISLYTSMKGSHRTLSLYFVCISYAYNQQGSDLVPTLVLQQVVFVYCFFKEQWQQIFTIFIHVAACFGEYHRCCKAH